MFRVIFQVQILVDDLDGDGYASTDDFNFWKEVELSIQPTKEINFFLNLTDASGKEISFPRFCVEDIDFKEKTDRLIVHLKEAYNCDDAVSLECFRDWNKGYYIESLIV